VERRRALLLPANLLGRPVVVLPLLPWTPEAPLLPPPRKALRCKFAADAFFLKHVVQNLARGEAAFFLQPGLQHLFCAFLTM